MYLLQIKNRKKRSLNKKKIEKKRLRYQLLGSKYRFLEELKEKKIESSFIANNRSVIVYKDILFVKYILGIARLKKNTVLYVTDIKKKLIFSLSAGDLGLKGFQKIKVPFVFFKLLDFFVKHKIFKKISNQPISFHSKNVTKIRTLKILTYLLKKKNLYIVSIKKFNSTPYNGCRPRKLKRKKRRKLSFNT